MELVQTELIQTELIETELVVEVLAKVLIKIVSRAELKAQVKIRQPKELKAEELEVFNSLRLSMVLLIAIRYQDSLKS